MSKTVPIKYLLDSNIFIQAHKMYYQFDFCPAYWEWIQQLNTDGLLSIDKVYEELSAGNDTLAEWVKSKKSKFVKFDSISLPVLQDIYNILKNEKVPDNRIKDFMETSLADSYLIAYAKAHNCILITLENRTPSLNSKKKVHIPNVCDALGVACTTIYEIMRKDREHKMILSSNNF
ncbi:MAG: DUF4411 family protein [Succinivibrio sp.]